MPTAAINYKADLQNYLCVVAIDKVYIDWSCELLKGIDIYILVDIPVKVLELCILYWSVITDMKRKLKNNRIWHNRKKTIFKGL